MTLGELELDAAIPPPGPVARPPEVIHPDLVVSMRGVDGFQDQGVPDSRCFRVGKAAERSRDQAFTKPALQAFTEFQHPALDQEVISKAAGLFGRGKQAKRTGDQRIRYNALECVVRSPPLDEP